jgi:hypothetical protein
MLPALRRDPGTVTTPATNEVGLVPVSNRLFSCAAAIAKIPELVEVNVVRCRRRSMETHDVAAAGALRCLWGLRHFCMGLSFLLRLRLRLLLLLHDGLSVAGRVQLPIIEGHQSRMEVGVRRTIRQAVPFLGEGQQLDPRDRITGHAGQG